MDIKWNHNNIQSEKIYIEREAQRKILCTKTEKNMMVDLKPFALMVVAENKTIQYKYN